MQGLRKFVGRGIVALVLAALVVLAVAVQSGQAARSTRMTLAAAVRTDSDRVMVIRPEATLSAQCTAALNALKSAFKGDRTEDSLESANNTADTETGAEKTEDTNETAARKAQFSAVASACGPAIRHARPVPPPPTPQCTAAVRSLKLALAGARAEAMAEFANQTEWTAADQAEDKSQMAATQPLWAAVKAACFSGRNAWTTSFDGWSSR